MKLPGFYLSLAIAHIQAENAGELCQCRKCRAYMVASFAHDLVDNSGLDGPELLHLIAQTAHRCFVQNGVSATELIKAIARLDNPQWEHMNINVSVKGMTEEDRKLFETPVEGNA